MAAFFYWAITVPFLVGVVIRDMFQATRGKSMMDKFREEHNK
jgi:hypothetical protein